MNTVKWEDLFGKSNLLIEGKGDDVFYTVPSEINEEGDSFVRILSKKAIIEMAEKLKSSDS